MAINPQQLPHQMNTDAVNGANQRATQNVFMSIPRFVSFVAETAYTEPMILNVGGEKPDSIELVDVDNLLSPGIPVTWGGVSWDFRPDLGGAQINSIDGLTSNPASSYRFVFRITYKAQV